MTKRLLLTAVVVLTAGLACAPAAAQHGAAGTALAPLERGNHGVAELERELHLDLREVTLEQALRAIATRLEIGLTYAPGLPGLSRTVTLRGRYRGGDAFRAALSGSGVEMLVAPGRGAVLRPAAPGEAGARTVRGSVRDAETGAALAGVLVESASGGRRAITDAAGAFSLGPLPPGEHALTTRRIGYASETVPVASGTGTRGEVEILLRPQPTPLESIVVTPGRFGIAEASPGARQTLTMQQFRQLPQLGEDVFRAVNRLPGVAAQDFSARFHVRGGRSEEMLVVLDGLELVEPYHLKELDGAISIVDLAAVGELDLVSGGYTAEHGDRLTGVLDMRSRTPPPGSTAGAGISLTAMRLLSGGTFADERGGWLLSARRGYLDLALRMIGEDFLRPRYGDLFGRVDYRLPHGHSLRANVLHATDALFFEPDEFGRMESAYRNSHLWLTWEAPVGPRLRSTTLVSVSRLGWARAGEFLSSDPRPFRIHEDRGFRSLGVKQDWLLRGSERWVARAGLDLRNQSAAYDYDRWESLGGDLTGPDGTRPDEMRIDAAPAAARISAYLTQRVQPLPRVTVETGLRVDHHEHLGETLWSPRLNLALAAGPRTTLRGSWGRYNQAQALHELQVMDGVATFHPAERARHLGAGVEQRLSGSLLVRAEGYDRVVHSVRPRFVNLFDFVAIFPEMASHRHRLAPESAAARGVELYARLERGPLGGSASYTLASTTDRLDGRDVPRAIDQRHAVQAELSYTPSPAWSVGAAWVFHSGWPYTPLQVAPLPGSVDVFHLVPTTYNSARYPAYHRMDVRALRRFHVAGGSLTAHLDLYNLYNRRNVFGYDHTLHWWHGEEPRLERSSRSLIPFLPSVGLSWQL